MTRPKAHENRRGDRAEGPKIRSLPDGAPVPDPPGELGDAGQAVWGEVWEALRGRLDRKADRLAVLHLAKLADLEARLEEIVRNDGLGVIGSTGQPVVHPAQRELSAIRRDMRQSRADLGLTPERRLALYGGGGVEESELDRFIVEST